ncbi:MAG: DJ-1/PfpI family protein [Fibrobacteria bacterium]|nr:DJ-1/PfpI family protein [Fibrobacteria bacterium]
MKKVVVLLAEGFEEIETVTPVDLLRRGGIQVDIAAVGKDKIISGGQKITLQADIFLSEVESSSYDLLFIPGGGLGVQNLLADEDVPTLIRDFSAAGKWIASICAGPKVLVNAGVLQDSCITSYPTVKNEVLSGIKSYSEDRVVVDGNIITSRGAGCAEAFGLMVLEKLVGPEEARRVAEAIITGLVL